MRLLPLGALGAAGAPVALTGFADDAGAALTGATTAAGTAFTVSFLAGFWATISSSLSESRAAKLFMASLVLQ